MTSNALTNLRGQDPGANRQTDTIARLVEPVAKAVMATPIMGAKPPAWIPAQLTAAFLNQLAGWAPCRYHRDALGYVHVQGHVKAPGGSGVSATITTLPPGLRPGSGIVFVGAKTTGFATLSMMANGNLLSDSALGAGFTLAFAFSFMAEQ